MSNTAPSRADPVVVFPLGRWCPPQETSQPHPPLIMHRGPGALYMTSITGAPFHWWFFLLKIQIRWKIWLFIIQLKVSRLKKNKANLRDLIAATGLVILLKFDPNHRFFSRVTLKFDGWPWKTIGHIIYTTSSFVHHFKSIGELKLKLQSGNTQFGSKSAIFCPVWPWNLMDNLRNQ